jgi:multidrug efflux pump subunit AcrB
MRRPLLLLVVLASCACHRTRAPAAGPGAIVRVAVPGRPASEAEGAAMAIEHACGRVEHLARLRSASADGAATVWLELDPKQDGDAAIAAAQACVRDARATLPVEASAPSVARAPGPVVGRWVWSGAVPRVAIAELLEKAHESLAQIAGVASVASCGGVRRRLLVDVDAKKLAAFGLTVADLVTAIASSSHASGGAQPGATGPVAVLREIVVDPKGPVPVRLRDLAVVEDGAEDEACVAFDGTSAVAETVVRAGVGADASSVAKSVTAKMTELTQAFPPSIAVRPFVAARVLTVDPAPGIDPRAARQIAEAARPVANGAMIFELGATDPLDASRAGRVLLAAGDDATAEHALQALRALPLVRSAGEPNAAMVLASTDRAKLDVAARDLETRLGRQVVDRVGTSEMGDPEARIDEAMARRLGVPLTDVRTVLAANLGVPAGTWSSGAGAVPIIVRAKSSLEERFVRGTAGFVPVSAMVVMTTEPHPVPALHDGQLPAVELRVEASDPGRLLSLWTAPAGVSLRVDPLAPAR